MGLKDAVTSALGRGVPAAPGPPGVPLAGDRLLERPAFILSSVRSGSTLLRVLLDSHSLLHAPHELHLRHVRVRMRNRASRRAMAELGLDRAQLDFLLWDRLLHREVVRHGKRHLVNKTPNDVFIARAIRTAWPDARLIYLLRHPSAIAASRAAARPQDSEERNVAMVLRYGEALERARADHPGLEVRYEELTRDPEGQLRRVCDHLGVPFEPAMLDYDRFDHGAYRVGLGDWSEKIRSGVIHPAPPPPEDVPDRLRALCAAWGYGTPPTR